MYSKRESSRFFNAGIAILVFFLMSERVVHPVVGGDERLGFTAEVHGTREYMGRFTDMRRAWKMVRHDPAHDRHEVEVLSTSLC